MRSIQLILMFLLITLTVSAKIWKENPSYKGLNSNGLVRLNDFSKLAKKLSPAVVNIQVETEFTPRMRGFFDPMYRHYNPFLGNHARKFRNKGLGSGFIINRNGYILTNNHVIEDATTITVTLLGDDKIYKADIVGVDKKTDLALLKIKADKKLSFAYLGDSDKLKVGEWVVAIGNPFGLQHTVTAGIVSAKGRKEITNRGGYYNFIQTDASINPGNSGGPLFNIKGEVVGINTAITSSGQGIGFAIPINMVKNIVEQIIKYGKVKRAWLGVSIQNVSKSLAESFNLKESYGSLIVDVVENSPADKAGLRRGDLILKFDNKKLKTSSDLSIFVSMANIGDKKNLLLLRDGKKKNITVKLEDSEGSRYEVKPRLKNNKNNLLGFDVRNLTKREKYQFKESGVLITEIDKNSIAYRAGIRNYDLILKIDQFKINSKKDFKDIISKRGSGIIRFYIKRRDGYFFVAFRI